MINKLHEICPVCKGSSDLNKIREYYDDRYGYPCSFPLMRCSKCGHCFLQADFTPDEIKKLYSEYYPRSSFKVENFRPHRELTGFNAWLDGAKSSAFRWVPRNIRILDIGCGFGETLGYHQARGCDVYGVEADYNIKRVADTFGYKVHVGLFDPTIYQPDFFDYVTMHQVIEHVQDPIETLQGIARVLKPGGIVILSTPNANGWGAKLFGRYWINWHAPYHLQFFTLKSLKLASDQAGLVVEKKITLTPSAWLSYQWIHLSTYPREGVASVFWAQGGQRNILQRLTYKISSTLHRYKINHVITRLFDLLGIGDNQLFFLRKPLC